MYDIDTIIDEFRDGHFKTFGDIEKYFSKDDGNSTLYCYFQNLFDFYKSLAIPEIDSKFIKSIVNSLKIAKYFTDNNKGNNWSFVPKNIEYLHDVYYPCIENTSFLSRGTLNIFSIPDKNMVEYTYARLKKNLGIISFSGKMKFTKHDENIKEAFDILFKMGDC